MPTSSIQDYERYRQIHVKFDDISITAVSKPGFDDWQSVLPAEILISKHVEPLIIGNVLLLGCRNGALATHIMWNKPGLSLWMSDDSFIALECTKRTLNLNQLAATNVIENINLIPEFESFFDAIIFLPDKGRKLARRKLVEGFRSLKPSGRMILAGSKAIGIHSIISDAGELFDCNPKILGYKKGSRAVLIEKKKEQPACDWSIESGTAPQSWHTFEMLQGDKTLTIYTIPGVFSYEHLDEGTALLLESIPPDIEGNILDIGCGCGAIGLSLATRNELKINRVVMVDSNLMAVAAARHSLAQNRSIIGSTPQMEVQAGDLMVSLPDHAYDFVLSNPPFHTGPKTNYDVSHALIAQSPRVLKPNGRLILVANHFLRYDKIMEQYFPKVEISRKTNRFHVISAQLEG